MNTLQKQKFAAAMGMSADQLSDLILKRGDLNKMMLEAERRGETDLLNQLKQQDMQSKFNDLIVKMQTIFVDIAGGPIGKLATGISSMLENTVVLHGVLGMIAAIKIAGLVSSVMSLGAALGIAGVGALTLMSALTLGLATIAVVGAIAYGSSIMDKEQKKAAQPKMKNYANLGQEEMVTLEQGSAIFDKGESVVRTDNFGKMNDTLQSINESINNQKLAFTVETHHATRYR